jgi:hypothetical protein
MAHGGGAPAIPRGMPACIARSAHEAPGYGTSCLLQLKFGVDRVIGDIRKCAILRVCSVRERSGTECHGSIPLEWVGFLVFG